jgi:cobalt-zinc-cadmium efflux system protein
MRIILHNKLHAHHQEMAWGKRLIISMVMNLIIPVIQITGGIISGSMALISDILHNLTDFISLLINYGALLIGLRNPTHKQNFGYKRVAMFATLISVSMLFGISFYMVLEAWQRWRDSRTIAGEYVIWIALLGVAGNLISAWMLHSVSKVNLNIKSAFIHMLSDAATSLALAMLGVVWLFKPWYWLDPFFPG